MATIMKVHYTYWMKNGDRVSKDTPGAKKVKIKSEKWYASWKEGKQVVRVPLATDKRASQVMLADILRKNERMAAGIEKPVDRKPVVEHVEEYRASILSSGKVRSAYYHREKKRILNLFFKHSKIRFIGDITAEAVDSYITSLTSAIATKRVHMSCISSFVIWLVSLRRLPVNPLLGIARPRGGKIMRKRRALGPQDLQRLIDATRVRPLEEAKWNTGGVKNKEKRRFAADLSAEYIEKLKDLGRERALIYMTAIYTGLRRNELDQLRVKYLDLNREPYASIELPGEFCKNGDEARLLLVPSLANDLRDWVKDKKPDDKIFEVHWKMFQVMKADLVYAGIPYQDERGRTADFHSLRKSANTMLGVAGVPIRIRQLFMRHSDLRLTMATYDDADFSEMSEAVRALEKTGIK